MGGNRGPSTRSKERLYDALELATKFYQAHLTKNRSALEYLLQKRGFSKQTVLQWQLGYSPNNGSALIDFLRSKGFKDTELKLAGLTSQHYRGGLQDMFRGRVQIPLCDPPGRVVGFTARLLDDDPKAPKYINTPSTPLYDKSRHVFGLHLAKDAIRKSKYVVLAEGNLDVIQSHQSGVRQIVATAGTALTIDHLKALKRLTGDIRLCFDADKAGLAATERAIPIAHTAGVNLQIITIPSGKDPDELIRQDETKWLDIIAQPQYVVDWLIERYHQSLPLDTALGKREFSNVVLRVVRQLPDSVEQDHYLDRLADIMSVNKEALRAKLHETETPPPPLRRHAQKPANYGEVATEKQRIEEHLMALTLHVPATRRALYGLHAELFDDLRAKEVFMLLQTTPDYDGSDMAPVQKFAEYGKMLGLVFETLYQDIDALEQANEAARLQAKLVGLYVRNQKQGLVAELQDAEPQKAEQLLARARELDELLRNNQA